MAASASRFDNVTGNTQTRVGARIEAFVFGRSNTRIMASNPTRGMDMRMSVLSFTAVGRSHVRTILPNIPSELDLARRRTTCF
jgi:hypothetical protein